MKPEFLGSTTVSERGQVVIPQEARTALNLGTGEKLLVFKIHEGSIVLAKVSAFEKMAEKMEARQSEITKIVNEVKGSPAPKNNETLRRAQGTSKTENREA